MTSTVGSHYVPGEDEFQEQENLVIVGEADEDRGNDSKPMRSLTEFTIFDPNRGLELISLNMLEDHGDRWHFEAAGYVAPVIVNEEDAGQEDDIENDVDDSRQRLRTTDVFKYEIDYTQPNE